MGIPAMKTRGFIWRLMMGMLLSTICGCTTVQRSSVTGDQPYLVAGPSDSKALQNLSRKQDRALKGCTKASPPCEQLLYARALVALFESQARATRLFQQTLASRPGGSVAPVSTQWLALLRRGASSSDPSRALLSQYVIREVLEREASPAQVRMKAQDKRIEELTRQLELLKQIEQQRRVHDLPLIRPPGTVPPE
jgi:hypothetical protein